MERTASRPPAGGGANWAVFFAPLAVTGVVILGALIFVWVSDPEPADRPEIETVDLRELKPVPEQVSLSAVPTSRRIESGPDEEVIRPVRTPGVRRESPEAHSEVALAAEEEEYEDYDDEYDDDEPETPKGPDQRTPEEIAAAKARARGVYLGGQGVLSKALNMIVPKKPSEAAEGEPAATVVGAELAGDQPESAAPEGEPTAVGAETAASGQQEPAVPTEDLRALGGASGHN